MKYIILTIRLGIDKNDKKTISDLIVCLERQYIGIAKEFIQEIIKASQIKFEGLITSEMRYSEMTDPLLDLRHPKIDKDGKWYLDNIKIDNKKIIWIKLENQWIRGKVNIKGNESNILIEPEEVSLPIIPSLFLKW